MCAEARRKEAQFICEICNEGFEQRSRFDRHLATSHPERAVSAADIEKALSEVQFPKSKKELLKYVLGKENPDDVIEVIKTLPEREYRDAAEVAIGLGEAKSSGRRSEKVSEIKPSERGGLAAMEVRSAAAIAKIFGGITFPASQAELESWAKNHQETVREGKSILKIIEQLPQRQYRNMADVEKAAGKLF